MGSAHGRLRGGFSLKAYRYMVKCLKCGDKMIAKKNLMGSIRCSCWNLDVNNYDGTIEARDWSQIAIETKKGWKKVIEDDSTI